VGAPPPCPSGVLLAEAMGVAALSVAVDERTERRRATRLAGALGEVLSSPGRRAALVVIAVVVALGYTLLLPFDFTQRLELANWDFLTVSQAIWSALLGAGMGLVLVVQGYAMRRVARARAATGAAGGVAFVVSLLPSFLCCTPFIPTLLAFVGLSGVSLYSTTGAVQHVFAAYQGEFLAGSLLLLLGTAWWGLHKVATASCFGADGCESGLRCSDERDSNDPNPKEVQP
jgi:hypothetical protein